MKIGLYGGTFDPIHAGHLILARDAVEILGLDRLVFIPAMLSPHKLERTPGASADARLEMIRAAIAGEPEFAVDDIELTRGGTSFTFDTVTAVRARFPGATLHYLIGEDNVRELETWHRIAELKELVEFVVLSRGADPGGHPFRRLPRRVEISSTEIRSRIANGRTIRYLVPEPVRQIIHRLKLYQEPPN